MKITPKSIRNYLFIISSLLFLVIPAESQIIYRDITVPTIRNGGVAVQAYKYKRNDNTILIYGKVYRHYVLIDNVYYNCKDKKEIVEAIVRLNKRIERYNKNVDRDNAGRVARSRNTIDPSTLMKHIDRKMYIKQIDQSKLKD